MIIIIINVNAVIAICKQKNLKEIKMNADKILYNIKDSYNKLSSLKQDRYQNSKAIKDVLDDLTDTCLQANCMCNICQTVLKSCNDNNIDKELQDIFYQSEIEMEQSWGERFASIENITFDDLKQFYRFNKSLLVAKRELGFIKDCGSTIKKIAFIGSGSFPMSALILDHISDHAFDIDLIDYDPTAIKISSKYCTKLSNKFSFIESKAIDIDYKNYDLVFIANMIIGKKELVDKLHKTGVKFIIARSTENLSQLFYKPTDLNDFKPYVMQKIEHGTNISLSSSYLYQHPDL